MRRGLLVCMALFVALSMSAIGSIRGSAQDATPDAEPSKLAALGLPELVITATDDGYTLPAEAPAGLTLVTLDNQSAALFGEAQFIQLPEGITLEQWQEDLQSENTPEWFFEAVWAGGPSAAPGTQGRVVLNLTPGAWTIGNTDSETPYPPASLTITGEPVEPAADAVPTDLDVEMGPYTFNFPDEVAAGQQIWQVSNTHTIPHHIVLLSYPEAVTVEQVEATLMTEATGTPVAGALDFAQVQDAGYIPVLSGGQSMWLEPELAPGHYIALCFISDKGAEAPHAAMGMIDVFTVTGEQTTRGRMRPAAVQGTAAGARLPLHVPI